VKPDPAPNATLPARPYRSTEPALENTSYERAERNPRKRPLLLRLLGPLRPILWRLIVAVVLLNLLLAGALYIQRGEIPGIVSSSTVALRPGQNVTVVVDGLNLRMDAGMSSSSIGTLSAGQQVYLRGQPVTIDGDRWWPVTIGNPNDGLDGYVWENGLEQGTLTFRDRFDRRIDDVIDRLRERIGV
jgi:hypothetical protein